MVVFSECRPKQDTLVFLIVHELDLSLSTHKTNFEIRRFAFERLVAVYEWLNLLLPSLDQSSYYQPCLLFVKFLDSALVYQS